MLINLFSTTGVRGAVKIANALQLNASITSLSLSHNPKIGDKGLAALVENLPPGLRDLGLVDCGITDKGAEVLLEWARDAKELRMLCVDQNSLSKEMQMLFREKLAGHNNIGILNLR